MFVVCDGVKERGDGLEGYEKRRQGREGEGWRDKDKKKGEKER